MELYRKYPALFSFLTFALGILLSLKFGVIIGTFFLIPGFLMRKTPFILLLFIVLGSLRTIPLKMTDKLLEEIEGKRIVCDIETKWSKRGRVKAILVQNKKIKTNFDVILRNCPNLPSGTKIGAEGTIKKIKRRKCRYLMGPFSHGDTCWTFFIEGWHEENAGLERALRQRLLNFISNSCWNEQNEALLLAFLAGRRDYLSRNTKKNFKKLGIYHLLALSGLHLGILWMVAEVLLTFLRIQKPYSGFIATLILAFFVITVGIRPSLMRALFLTSVLVFSYSFSRKHISLNALGVAGFISLLYDPTWVMNVGFLLSYLATSGILLALPLLRFKNLPKFFRMVAFSLSISTVAQISTFPLVAFAFREIPLSGPLANLLTIPLLTLILAESVLLLLFSTTFLRTPLTAILNFLLTLFSKLLNLSEKINPPVIHMKLASWTIFLLYLGIGILFLLIKKLAKN